MKYRIVLVLLIAVLPLFFSQTGAAQTQQTTKAEQEVRKLERAWLDAYEQHDVKAMDAIVADDFTITFANGSMQTKSQILESIKTPRRPGNPGPKFHTEDVQSRVYGNTVILIGLVVTEYQRDGKTMKDHSRYTDTYVQRSGRWQVVASHLSNVAQPQTPKSSGSLQNSPGRSLHENGPTEALSRR